MPSQKRINRLKDGSIATKQLKKKLKETSVLVKMANATAKPMGLTGLSIARVRQAKLHHWSCKNMRSKYTPHSGAKQNRKANIKLEFVA